MKIKSGTIVKHRKHQSTTRIFFGVPFFYPQDRKYFTLEEMQEIVKEMEKMNAGRPE